MEAREAVTHIHCFFRFLAAIAMTNRANPIDIPPVIAYSERSGEVMVGVVVVVVLVSLSSGM